MQISFTKMQGCGNDYVYVDCRGKSELEDYVALRAKQLADRHFGVGGDGVILVCDSTAANCRMRIFNADGGEAEMCGNGIRCVAALVGGEAVSVETRAGIKTVTKNGDLYSVDMGAATVAGNEVNIGNPHRVFFVEDVDGIDIEDITRGMDEFNVEFAEVVVAPGCFQTIKMRVHERGSGETLACGTGACAVAVMAAERGLVDAARPIKIISRGGELVVDIGDSVTLTGGAEVVFSGVIDA